jgi:hypothetical protein
MMMMMNTAPPPFLGPMMTAAELAAYDAAEAAAQGGAKLDRGRSNAFYATQHEEVESNEPLPPNSSSGRATGMCHVLLTSHDNAQHSSTTIIAYNGQLSSEGLCEDVFSSTTGDRMRVGFAHTQGRRPTMEDAISIVGRFAEDPTRSLIALFDGHNGHACAQLAARHLHTLVYEQFADGKNPKVALKKAFLAMSQMIIDAQLDGGATALCVFAVDELVFVANAGDCRCVARQRTQAGAVRITRDHSPNNPDEERRIKKLGGRIEQVVTNEGKIVPRVQGVLGVARALGNQIIGPVHTHTHSSSSTNY